MGGEGRNIVDSVSYLEQLGENVFLGNDVAPLLLELISVVCLVNVYSVVCACEYLKYSCSLV